MLHVFDPARIYCEQSRSIIVITLAWRVSDNNQQGVAAGIAAGMAKGTHEPWITSKVEVRAQECCRF